MFSRWTIVCELFFCAFLVYETRAFYAPFLNKPRAKWNDSDVPSARMRRASTDDIHPNILEHSSVDKLRFGPGNSSSMFMVELFESLYTGHNLVNPSNKECRAIEEADTVRSYKGAIKGVVSSSDEDTSTSWMTTFPTFNHQGDDELHLAELRVQFNQSTVQRNLIIELHHWVRTPCQNPDDVDKECRRRQLLHARELQRQRFDDFDGREVFDVTAVVRKWTPTIERGDYAILLKANPVPENIDQDDHAKDKAIVKALLAVEEKDRNSVADDIVDSNDVDIVTDFQESMSEAVPFEDVTLVVFSRAPSAPLVLQDARSSVKTRTTRSAAETRRRKKQKELQKLEKEKQAEANAEKLRREQENSGPCRRVDMEVDFGVIGWEEWIIYPKRFNGYRCVGQCSGPLDSGDNPSNHAIMQDLVRLNQPERRTPEPCCVPTKLQPLSMLYFEEGSVLVRHHEDMIVEECGCR